MRKSYMTAKSILIVAALITITLFSVLNLGRVRAKFSSVQDNEASEREAITQALRNGGLRGAAKLKRHYISEFDPHWDFSQLNTESLTKNSAAVIVGIPIKNNGGRLTADGQLIVTDFEVSVQETIKGDIAPGGTVIVSLVGGHVEFEDGTSAELKTPKFEHMRVGGTYTLFLTQDAATTGTYTLTGGPQGLLELADDATVKSHGRPTDPIAKESKDKDKETFLKEVREQSKKWPRPGKCCG